MNSQGLALTDVQGLNLLKAKAQQNSKEALPEVARQFEAIFLQAMMKSMRASQHFVDESSPFRGKNEETFQEMLDSQYVNSMTSNGGLGLAEMLAKQLGYEGDIKQKADNASITPAGNSTEISRPEKKSDSFESIRQFVDKLMPYAKKAASALGLDAKLLVAQAALETGWGQHIAADESGNSNNLFNIKAMGNDKNNMVKIKTTEYIADKVIKRVDAFKSYASIEESFDDYVRLIQGSKRYAEARQQAANPADFMQALQDAGYATDPLYAKKVLAIYQGEHLQSTQGKE